LVKQLCDRAIFLMEGRIAAEGDPSDVINRYVGSVLEKQKAWRSTETGQHQLAATHRHGDGAVEIRAVELIGEDGSPIRAVRAGEQVSVRLQLHFHLAQDEPMAGILIRTRNGLDAFGTNTKEEGIRLPACKPGDSLQVEFAFRCDLTPQEYTLTVAAQHFSGHSHDWLDDAIAFQVLDTTKRAGIANLPTTVTVLPIR
jgi:lipopolysaccharide transport system ATP-binding protein